MTKLLLKIFIKNNDTGDFREQYGKLAGVVGIVTNLFLGVLKLVIGFIVGDIAVIADGVNNATDTSSSVITLIGFRMAEKPADAEHPFGHARMEYLAGLAVSFIVLFLGVQLLFESVDKIFNPAPAEFSYITVGILCFSILLKIWQSGFFKNLGKKINSKTLLAASLDSRNDVVATFAVLISSIAGGFFDVALDGIAGIFVALFIIKSGIELIKETSSPLLGEHPDSETLTTITNRIESYEGVLGVHDVIVHNYGYGRCFVNAHVEVDSAGSLLESHELADKIEHDFALNMHMQLMLHLDPLVNDERTQAMRQNVTLLVKDLSQELDVHDFRTAKDGRRSKILFDVTVPHDFNIKEKELRRLLEKTVRDEYDNYSVYITIDRSFIPDIR